MMGPRQEKQGVEDASGRRRRLGDVDVRQQASGEPDHSAQFYRPLVGQQADQRKDRASALAYTANPQPYLVYDAGDGTRWRRVGLVTPMAVSASA